MNAMLAPPVDIPAERALLGSCLLDREAVIAVSHVPPAWFSLEKHATIWRAILACYGRRVPPDIQTVASGLRQAGELDAVGGLSALGELATEVPTAVHVAYYAEAVRRAATARAYIDAGARITILGYERAMADPDGAADEAERLLWSVTQGDARADAWVPASAIAQELYNYLQTAEDAGLSTGIPDLDRKIIGWRPARLYLIAARPGVGKTGFILSVAANALRRGARVGIYSLEMDRIEIGIRLAAMISRVDAQKIEAKTLSESDWAQIWPALETISGWNLVANDQAGLSITEVRQLARRAHAAEPFDLLIFDYLQLIEGRGEKRGEQVADVARSLKNLVRELRVPGVAAAQLNREVEGRQSKIPQLSDLRESGELEQAADLVGFLYRPEVYDPEDPTLRGQAELHIAKQRNGPQGVVPMYYDAPTTTFRGLAPDYRVIPGYGGDRHARAAD